MTPPTVGFGTWLDGHILLQGAREPLLALSWTSQPDGFASYCTGRRCAEWGCERMDRCQEGLFEEGLMLGGSWVAHALLALWLESVRWA